MKNLRKALLGSAAAVALLAAGAANADAPGTSVTQTATHLDAAAGWWGSAAGATSCNAVSGTSPSDTITITPPAGQYVYLTEFFLQHSTDATGATEVPTISMTNISTSGGLAAFLSAASTLSTTGYHVETAIPFPQGLKSAQPGVAVTFVPSATLSAHTIMCNSATGYFNAN
jgi:hypothetical protein